MLTGACTSVLRCFSSWPAGALLLDPFRTVVPAAAYPQPTAAEVYNMSLLDAHCGTFQQVGRGRSCVYVGYTCLDIRHALGLQAF
jgi:hypothetical protein